MGLQPVPAVTSYVCNPLVAVNLSLFHCDQLIVLSGQLHFHIGHLFLSACQQKGINGHGSSRVLHGLQVCGTINLLVLAVKQRHGGPPYRGHSSLSCCIDVDSCGSLCLHKCGVYLWFTVWIYCLP